MIIHENFPISDITWYEIGGKARYLIVCKSKTDILEAFDFVKEKKAKKFFVFGMGTNLIFTDGYFDGVVIKLDSSDQNDISIENEEVEVFAGVEFDDLIQFSFSHNLTGLEWGGGLPGTVGGAVRGNAGAYGGEVKDNLESIQALDITAKIPELRTLTNKDLDFSYRNSFIKQNRNLIVISAKFRLKKVDNTDLDESRQTYEKNIQTRKEKHPLEYPNTGSVFINPRTQEEIGRIMSVYPDLRESVENRWYGKVAVASLIDRWGLKGLRIGNAQISKKHALFIVNLGGARAADVLEIIDTVKKKFFATFGFELKTEVEIVI